MKIDSTLTNFVTIINWKREQKNNQSWKLFNGRYQTKAKFFIIFLKYTITAPLPIRK